MALDGILLHKIIPEIRNSLPARMQKIWQISSTEILFQTHGSQGKQLLLISCHSVYNRMLFTNRSYPTPNEPGNFIMVLRKYLEGGFIESIEQAELDRWCCMSIRKRNDLGDIERFSLYIELMGKYANVILVNGENKIIDALKRIPPFENSRRTIHPGALFQPTESQNKKDPFKETVVDTSMSMTKQFSGFSPFLSREVEFRMANGQTFASIMQEIESSKSLYIANSNNEAVFHCIELTHLGECRCYPLFEGFDILYYHKEEKDRIRQISGDIYRFVNRQLKHQKTKLPRLQEEYDNALECDKYRIYGELLYAYNITDTKGETQITLEDFEGQQVRIPLDPKLDGKGNARKHYTRYGKLKKGQAYLQEQIQICENEISYFEGLLSQLDMADFDTASEIRTELIRLGYIAEKKNPRRKKKEIPLHIKEVEVDGIKISFGRNNLQNDALTWHIAKKNDTWLHAKDYHGSHVVIHDPRPSEHVMRIAANIAAYYSAGRHSTSVPIMYCPIKNLKKIPGAKPGMVQLGSYRMIYIDPDEDQLSFLGISL